MSLNKFIEIINEPLEKLMSGIKVYGLAEAVLNTRGGESEPGIVANDGEILPVGPDDIYRVVIYHKSNGIITALSIIDKGYGNNQNSTVNAYGLSMIIWLDRKKTKLRPDELFLYVQANLPFSIEMHPYQKVLLKINSVILNGQQVYDSEFKGVTKKLPANQSLMQINYTIESTFKINCFEKCPEDC